MAEGIIWTCPHCGLKQNTSQSHKCTVIVDIYSMGVAGISIMETAYRELVDRNLSLKSELQDIHRMVIVSPVGSHELIIEKLAAAIARLG